MSNEPDASSGEPSDVGSRLRAAREARQITLREIAATTKISVSALEALEENAIARLPGGIFTRAFVRSYAAEVGLDPEQTMRDFMAQVPADGTAEEPRDERRSHDHDLFQSQQRMAGTVLKLVVVGLPVALVLLFFGTRAMPPEADAPAAPPVRAALDAPAVVEPPVLAEAPVLVAPAAPGPLMLVLRPRADCWVSLTIDGAPVFSRTMQAGERESYEADDEINLIIGDAGAFGFAINQQDGRSVGALGDTVTLHITRQNYRSFLAQ